MTERLMKWKRFPGAPTKWSLPHVLGKYSKSHALQCEVGLSKAPKEEKRMVICGGYPGLQNLEEFASSALKYKISTDLIFYQGIQQKCWMLKMPSEDMMSFNKTIEGASQYLSKLPYQVILAGYSLGSILLPEIIKRVPEKISKILIINGFFHTKEFCAKEYSYKNRKGWDAWEKYFEDCVSHGKVPINGNPSEHFKEFVDLVKKTKNLEMVLKSCGKKVIIAHSPADKIVPFAYMEKYFPKNAQFIEIPGTHEMLSIDSKTINPRAPEAIHCEERVIQRIYPYL